MKGEGADGETKRLRRRKRKNKMFTSLFLPTSLVREESGEIDVVLIQTKDGFGSYESRSAELEAAGGEEREQREIKGKEYCETPLLVISNKPV